MQLTKIVASCCIATLSSSRMGARGPIGKGCANARVRSEATAMALSEEPT